VETARIPQSWTRSNDDRVIAGVAGGLASHFGVPAMWIRLGFAVVGCFWGVGLMIYAALWITLPEDPWEEDEEVRPPLATDQPQAMVGVILLTAGLTILLWKILAWLSLAVVLPVVLVLAGLSLIQRGE